MAIITAAGGVAAFLWLGTPGLIGFAAGASFSILTFYFSHRVVQRLGIPEEEPVSARQSAILLALRYFVFCAAGYAIVNYFGASLSAILAGGFVAVAAVILEILYELIYART
jgi:hypothetical protein